MKRTIQPSFAPTPEGTAKFASQVSALFDRPRSSIRFTIGGEVTDTRRVTMQVVSRVGAPATAGVDYAENPTSNRFIVWMWVGTADFGAPAGTQVLTVITGKALDVLASDTFLMLLTDENGIAAVDIEVTGAGTRYVMAASESEVCSAGAIAWA